MKLIALLSWVNGIGMAIGATLSFSSNKNTVDDLYYYAIAHKNDLRLSAYITVHAVEKCLNDPDGRREAVSVLRGIGITKVYIETYRSGLVGNVHLLEIVRDYFKANGFEVAGGIAATPGKDFGVRQQAQLSWFNYQHPKTQADLEKVVRLSAHTFDEIIIDDFLCSGDTSDISEKARGNRSWSQYRMDLLTELSERLFVQTAREENSDISVIIKYPQWYDRFHLFGYDVVRQPRIFDKIWIGTETRGPMTKRMGYVQQYEGFVNFRWLSSFAPDKTGGAWFDHIDCDQHEFIDQAYQTVLAGAREIILFNYFDLMRGHSGHHSLRRQFSNLVELARTVRQQPAGGVYAYKPPHSDAVNDYYIYDYLGMIGIPLIPTSQLPINPEVTFLPTQAAADTELMQHVERLISGGKTVILTVGLLQAQANNQRLLELAGIQLSNSATPLNFTELILENKTVAFEQGLDLTAKLISTSAKVLLAARRDHEEWPLLTLNEVPSGGRLFVLNLHTFSEKDFETANEVLLAPIPVPWLDLPIECLNQIRRSFIKPPGIGFSGPGRVSLHPFGTNNWVLCNFNDKSVEIELTPFLPAKSTGGMIFENKMTKEKFNFTEEKLTLSIGKRQIVWLTEM